MPAGATPRPHAAADLHFIATAAAWMLGLFALLRLGPVQRYLLLPLAAAQQTMASQIAGAPRGTVVLDASCSGADVLALCMGMILASPAGWRERLRGIAGGVLLIAVLNTARIAHLSLIAGDPALLELMHVYVWPALLTIAVAAYGVWWLRDSALAAPARAQPGRRFLMASVALTGLYFALAPPLFARGAFEAPARGVAATAGGILSALGATVTVAGSMLTTRHGSFLVTQECIITPLIALYVAAALVAPVRPGRRALLLAATPLAFFALGTARLLVLAIPAPLLSSPETAVHGFSQMLLGVLLVGGAALWGATAQLRRGEPGARSRQVPAAGTVALRAGAAIAAGAAVLVGAAMAWTPALEAAVAGAAAAVGHAGHDFTDPQGALRILPAYQLGLLVALWLAGPRTSGRRRLAIALVALAASQALLLAGLGEFFQHLGVRLHTSLMRAWAIVAPVAVALALERPFPALRPADARAAGAEAWHETSSS